MSFSTAKTMAGSNASNEVEMLKKLGLDESTYFLVDIGANLTDKKFSRDLQSVVTRAKDCGIQKIMVTGTSITSSQESLRLARLFPSYLYSTAGKAT